MNADSIVYRFGPCRGHKDCGDCVGSYFDDDGRRHACDCDHHRTVDMFKAAPVSRQRDLFGGDS